MSRTSQYIIACVQFALVQVLYNAGVAQKGRVNLAYQMIIEAKNLF